MTDKDRSKEQVFMEVEDDLLWVTVAKYALFMSYGKKGIDALGLYMHYQFTARLQKTQSVWANDVYCRQGLEWGRDRFESAKNLLCDLDLIEVKQEREGGKFSKSYVVVKTKKVPLEPSDIHRMSDFRQAGKTASGKTAINALTRKGNALTNKVSKDTNNDSLKKESTIDISKLNVLMNYYNDLPNVQKHKNNTTKVYKQCSKYIKYLQSGQFGRRLRKGSFAAVIDLEWFKSQGLMKWMNHKFSDEEIKIMFDNINNYFDKEYYPNSSKKSLETMFFNSMDSSGKSLALWLFANPPILGKQHIKSKYPELVEMYEKTAFLKKLNKTDHRFLVIALNSFCDVIEEKKKEFKEKGAPSIDGIYRIHAKWLSEIIANNKNTYSPQHLISTKNGFWDGFVSYFDSEYSIDLEKPVETLTSSLKRSDTTIKSEKTNNRLEKRKEMRKKMIEADVVITGSKLDERIDHLTKEKIDELFGEENFIDLSEFDAFATT